MAAGKSKTIIWWGTLDSMAHRERKTRAGTYGRNVATALAGGRIQAKAPAGGPPALSIWRACEDYFRALLTSENSCESLVPSWPRIVTRAIAINEAISAYSMAVAPDSSDAKSFTNFMTLLQDRGDGL